MKHLVPCALAIVLFAASEASAQVPAGGEIQVNTYTTWYQFQAEVAAMPDGGFVAIWVSSGQDGSESGIFGQRYDGAGVRQGAEFQVNTYTTDYQRFHEVAADADGGFVVVWESVGQDGDQGGVFARRYDAAGTPRGVELQVNAFTTARQGEPAVAVAPAGGFVVAWSSAGQDGDQFGVFARRYDASGAPLGAEFQVNTYTTGYQLEPAIAADDGGRFVVAWSTYGQDGDLWGVFARRFDASGAPLGAEFRVNSHTSLIQATPDVAMAPSGSFVVVWVDDTLDGSMHGVFGQAYDAAGAPLGPQFQVNTFTTFYQLQPSVAADGAGNFTVAWESIEQDGDVWGVFAQRYDSAGSPRGAEFRVNSYTTSWQEDVAVACDRAGNFVVAWESLYQNGDRTDVFAQRFGGLTPAALAVDASATAGSDGNRVLEPGETVTVAPSWRNRNGAAQTFVGKAPGFTGPPASGVSYDLTDDLGSYGAVPDGATAPCVDCYGVGVGFGGTRPSVHWDATFTEQLLPDAMGQAKTWLVHVGDSFTDVPRVSPYYRFVETLLHHNITGGCSPAAYCPANPVTREQMSVFVLGAKEGQGFAPPACSPPNLFDDVPETSPFCRWIEELATRGVVGGCGPGLYCPTSPVTREQMGVFVLRTLDPALDPPACSPPNLFDDVPETSPFCRWIEELARRGVVSGCGGGDYCPTNPVTREQMGVFISASFGLSLYGP